VESGRIRYLPSTLFQTIEESHDKSITRSGPGQSHSSGERAPLLAICDNEQITMTKVTSLNFLNTFARLGLD
jgi:hypothetical protein